MMRRIFRIVRFGILGLMILVVAAVGIIALTNTTLPTRSQFTDRLSEAEKARLAEVIHLRRSLGDAVWPGWSEAAIPIIVYNEAYAFLVGYPDPDPPAGWEKMPQGERRGGPWEAVPGDAFEGQVYYRQRLTNPEITPEAFTVRVGDRWAATLATKEYGEVDFYAGYRDELPPALKPIFPYRLFWGLLMGESETYIGALEHESFHALQGSLAPDRLGEAEAAASLEDRYPWDEASLDDAWRAEGDLLIRAIRASSDAEAAELARQFLAQRDARRAGAGLAPELIDYERQREWEEGLAKYAELAIQRAAATTPGYTPVPALATDPSFKGYRTRERFWRAQIDEAKRTAGRGGETRFYYVGMAQAVLLDRLMPGWKTQAFEPGVMLEGLLREAVGGSQARHGEG